MIDLHEVFVTTRDTETQDNRDANVVSCSSVLVSNLLRLNTKASTERDDIWLQDEYKCMLVFYRPQGAENLGGDLKAETFTSLAMTAIHTAMLISALNCQAPSRDLMHLHALRKMDTHESEKFLILNFEGL